MLDVAVSLGGPERWCVGDVFNALRVLLDFARECREEFLSLVDHELGRRPAEEWPSKQAEGLVLWKVIDPAGAVTAFGRELLVGIRFGEAEPLDDQRICGFANPVVTDDREHFGPYWGLLRYR